MFTPKKLFEILEQLTSSRCYLVAYSGGLDSHVLLHSLVQLRQHIPEIRLRVLHIDHGLHADAKHWSQHCGKICHELNVDYFVEAIKIDKRDKQGIEATARKMRYEVFASYLKDGENLLTAHQQDDQAETVLLQLLRGAGPQGLAAMPEKKLFYDGHHLRPLLVFSRQQLADYAKKNHLNWLVDDSNFDLCFDRNYLRQTVLPLLEKRWPAATATLARSAKNCARASELLADLAQVELKNCQCNNNALDIKKLLRLTTSQRFNVMRCWVQTLKLPLPSCKALHQIEKNILQARADALPKVAWPGVEVRRFQGCLFAMRPLLPFNNQQVFEWDLTSDLELGISTLKPDIITKMNINLPDTKHITIRFRQGGERMQVKGSRGRSELKKLLQQWKVPPWERDRIPLLYWHDQLVAVLGYGVCAEFQIKGHNDGKKSVGHYSRME